MSEPAGGQLIPSTALWKNPHRRTRASRMGVAGRYILTPPAIFDAKSATSRRARVARSTHRRYRPADEALSRTPSSTQASATVREQGRLPTTVELALHSTRRGRLVSRLSEKLGLDAATLRRRVLSGGAGCGCIPRPPSAGPPVHCRSAWQTPESRAEAAIGGPLTLEQLAAVRVRIALSWP